MDALVSVLTRYASGLATICKRDLILHEILTCFLDRGANMTKVVSKGVLKTWKDERGFGFIRPEHEGKDLFVHISAFKGMARRPVVGDTVFYDIAHDAGGKLKAVNACIEGVESTQVQPKTSHMWRWLIAIALGLISAAVAAYAYLI